MLDIYSEIVNLRREGRPAVLVTVVAREGHIPTELQATMLVDAGGRVAGTVGGGSLEHLALADAREVLARRQPLLREYLLDDNEPDPDDPARPTGMICGGPVTLFHEVLAPGADYATLPQLPDLADSFVVIATHSHVCDERVLEQLLRTGVRPRYLGVVASRRKRTQMYAGLRERLGQDLDLDWIHMPVGLALGGNTPAAVALSIAAEMQACRSGATGRAHLRDRPATPPRAPA